MKTLLISLFIMILHLGHAQDYSFLDTIQFDTYENEMRVALESAEYLTSIPINQDDNNRVYISKFHLKLLTKHFDGDIFINPNIAELIGINKNLLGVYFSYVTINLENNSNDLDNNKELSTLNVIDYCLDMNNRVKLSKSKKESLKTLKSTYGSPILEESELSAPNKTDANGLKQGYWKEYYEDEDFDFAIIYYKDDKMHGDFKAYRANDILYIYGNFRDGMLHGEHFQYYKSGSLKFKSNFVSGKENGIRIKYRSNGAMIYEVLVKNNKFDGPWKEYHENGKIYFTGNYRNGEKVGVWNEYSDDGTLLRTDDYDN